MRIIAGKYKRRQLLSPATGVTTRPTSDRVKENLFNIVNQIVPDACVLDLFAGTGALGLEALSRGAKHVVFVERDKHALNSIRANIKALQIPSSHYTVWEGQVEDFLKSSSAQFAASINLVFADPPYNSEWYNSSLADLENSGLCAPECLIVLEMPHVREMSEHPLWGVYDERVYGIAKLMFFQKLMRG